MKGRTWSGALVALAAIAAGGVAEDADRGVLARHRDKLTAAIDGPGDTDGFTVELFEEGRFDLALKAAKGSALLPSIRLFDPAGAEHDVTAFVKRPGSAKPALKKFIVPAGGTGVWTAVVDGSGTEGGYAATFKVKDVKSTKLKELLVFAGTTETVEFTARGDALLTVTLKSKRGGPLLPAVRILDPAGALVADRSAFTERGSRLFVKRFPVAGGFGRYRLELDGDVAEDVVVAVNVKAKLPKFARRKVEIAPEATLTDATPISVQQGQSAFALTLTGTNFTAGSRAEVAGGGVTVTGVTVNGPTTAQVLLDVAADAPFGARAITLVPPRLDGEPVTLDAALTVLAPDPLVTGAAPTAVRQGDTDLTVAIDGTGFRDGGTLTVSGTGLTLGAVEVVSDVLVRVPVTVAIDAEKGPRDVTWTQPAAGGGAQDTGVGVLSVHYPDPTVTAVSESVLRQEQADVLLTITGTGFRSGGALTTGSGVTLANATFVNETTFEVTASVDAAAAFGARALTYTQPADGGGASGSLDPAFDVHAPDPTVTGADPTALQQLDTSRTFELQGTGFRDGGSISFSGTGITLGATTVVSDTLARAAVTVAADAPVGLRDVTWTQPALGGGAADTSGGLVRVEFPAPGIGTVAPSVLRQGDVNVTLTLTGSNFRDGGTVAAGAGVTVSNPTHVSDSTFEVTVSVDAAAGFGTRTVTYTHPASGGGASVDRADAFTVEAPIPTVASVAPGTVVQGAASELLTVTGTGFRSGGTLSFSGTGITPGSTTVNSATEAIVTVAVDADATVGTRDVTFTQSAAGGAAAGTGTGILQVDHPVPTVDAVAPLTLRQGDANQTVTVTGTNFRSGGTLDIAGSGLVLGNTTVVNETTATVDASVAPDAPFGGRTVTFTQSATGGAKSGSRVDGITIHAPVPAVSSVLPGIVLQKDTAVVLTVSGAAFRSGGTLSISGTGITVGATSFIDETSASVPVTVATDAPVGLRDVTFTQPAAGGSAAGTGVGVLRVNHPDPTVSSASPTFLRQGATSQTVTVTGLDFRTGGTLSFSGTGLTLGTTTVVNETTATVDVTVATDATFGGRTVTYTQPAAGGGASDAQASALTIRAPIPTVTSLAPLALKQGATSEVLSVTGTGFRTGGTLTIEGTGLTLGSTTVTDDTTASVPVTVASDATVGDRDVTFTQPVAGGGDAGTGTDLLAIHHPDPAITSVTPDEDRRGESGTFTLTGTGFRTGGTVTTDATDVTLSSPTFVSDTGFDVDYDIDVNAATGTFDLTYQQPAAGGGAAVTLTDGYEVFPAGPAFTSIVPNTFSPGDTLVSATVTGAFFDSGTTVAFSGSGVTVHSTTFVSSTELAVSLSVASNAATGLRNITITPSSGPGATFDQKITVAPGDPTVAVFSHATLAKGASSVAVTIDGTNFESGATVAVSGANVTVGTVTVSSTTRITTTFSVASGAAAGKRDVTVTHSTANGGRSGTLVDAFEVVNAAPTVTSVNPSKVAVTGSGGPTRTVPVTITGTHFMSGATVAVTRSGGSGVTIVTNSADVVSPTRLDVELSITGTATTGFWDVKVTNPSSLGDSGTTGNSALDVKTAGTLTVNRVLSVCADPHGGERVTVHGGGFAAGDVVDFGTERGYLAQVLDQNTLVVTVPQPTTTSPTAGTAVDVKVTNLSASSATLTGGYVYDADDRQLVRSTVFPAQGATGVPQSLDRACILMSAPLDTSTVNSGTSSALHVFWFEAGGFFVTGHGVASGPEDRWLVLTATSTSLGINSGGLYVLNQPVAMKSISGTAFVPTRLSSTTRDQSTFTITTTTDSTAPTVTVTPANAAIGISTTAPVKLFFSEEIDPSLITGTNVTLKQGTTPIGAHLSLASDVRTVLISPHTELAHSTVYTVGVAAAVKDLHGNAITVVSSTFTTGSSTDTTNPTIDAVVIEGLPSDMDGSTTFTTGNDTNSSGQLLTSTGTSAFDLLLPRSGFELVVTFSDEGGAGIDPTTFSAKCSVAVGGAAANAELASNFTVTPTRAAWRLGASDTVATGDNRTFTFTVKDLAANTATNHVITFDVLALTTTSNHARGGDLDPFDSRDTWVFRTDLDKYTATFSTRTSPSTDQGMTTTVASSGLTDFEESLRLIGLNSGSMTTAAAATVNGADLGTNRILQRLVIERIRELTRERFQIEEDGTRDADSINIEFLLAGERGSLTSLPTYGTTSGTQSTSDHSEMSFGGTDGAETNAFGTTSGTLGRASFDVRNRNPQHDLNNGTGSILGIFLSGMFKQQVNDGFGAFDADISQVFVTVHGGTPVGEDADDDDVLAGTFDRTSGSNTTAQNDRYDDIMDAVELVALYASTVTAHEVGHSIGLMPDSGPKTGLFGWAHRDNTFTDATSSSPNTSSHMSHLAPANIMAPSIGFSESVRTGSEFKRFNPMVLGYLLSRILHDEGL